MVCTFSFFFETFPWYRKHLYLNVMQKVRGGSEEENTLTIDCNFCFCFWKDPEKTCQDWQWVSRRRGRKMLFAGCANGPLNSFTARRAREEGRCSHMPMPLYARYSLSVRFLKCSLFLKHIAAHHTDDYRAMTFKI